MLAFIMAVSPDLSGSQDDTIEQYLARIAAGDKEALASLYEQTHVAVYGFALSVLKQKQDAEDVVHDTYLRIWQAAGSYTPAGKPLAWIFTIARNLARMRQREQSRTVTVPPKEWQALFADMPAVSREDRVVLASLLGTLPDEERQIVMLHAMTGLKHREIAGLLQLKLPTVLSKYRRGLKKLHAAFKEAE